VQAVFEVAKSVCDCSGAYCEAKQRDAPDGKNNLCYCAFDRLAGDAFPCYEMVSMCVCEKCHVHLYRRTGASHNGVLSAHAKVRACTTGTHCFYIQDSVTMVAKPKRVRTLKATVCVRLVRLDDRRNRSRSNDNG
jgi:hypothetical protein